MSASLKRVCVAFLSLLIIYLAAVFVVPRLKIWSIPQSFNNNETQYVPLKSGDIYEQRFNMPFSRICHVDIPMKSGNAAYFVKFDAVMSVSDSSGSVVFEKEISSIYESHSSFRYINVAKGSEYILKLQILSIETTAEDSPKAMTDDNGNLNFTIKGIKGSSDNRIIFDLMFIIVCAAVIAFVWKLDVERIGDSSLSDKVIIAVLALSAVFLICQFNDLYDISRTAMIMIDSFRNGQLRYQDFAFVEELKEQSAAQRSICDYNAVSIAVIAVILLPLYPFFGSGYSYGTDGHIVVYYLSAMILALVLIAVWMVKLTVDECKMDKRYLANTRFLLITSSMFLYMTVGFGQIDIIYIIVLLLALPFYYRKKYLFFSLIMSVAVAMKTLPLLIFVPLLFFAVKKIRDIVIDLAAVLSVPLLTKLVFGGGIGNAFVVQINEEAYGFKNMLIDMKLGSSISLFVLFFILICIIAYFAKPDTEDKKYMLHRSMLIIFAVYVCFSIFVDWHQQWLIPLVLSFSFLLPFYKENKELLILSIVAELMFILNTNIRLGASTYMINFGIAPYIADQQYAGTTVRYLANSVSPLIPTVVSTAFAAVLIYVFWFMYKNRNTVSDKTYECPRQWVMARTGILYVFLLFYCWCFSFAG